MKVYLFKTMKRKHTWELIGLRGGCFNRVTCTTCGESRTTAYEPDAEWLQPGCYRIAIRDKLREGDLLVISGQIGEFRGFDERGWVTIRTGPGKYMYDEAMWERWH